MHPIGQVGGDVPSREFVHVGQALMANHQSIVGATPHPDDTTTTVVGLEVFSCPRQESVLAFTLSCAGAAVVQSRISNPKIDIMLC